MKVTVLEKLGEDLYLVMSDDGQTAIATQTDIDNLKKIGNLHTPQNEQISND